MGYCSKVCQRADWTKGHKTRCNPKKHCRGEESVTSSRSVIEPLSNIPQKIGANTGLEQMKAAVRTLFQSELAWLNGLTVEEKKQLFPDWGAKDDPSIEAPVERCCVTGEISLVLAGIKPCSVVSDDSYPAYSRKFYHEVLRPWYDKYFNEGCGFICELTAPGAAHFLVGKKKRSDFGGDAIFRNTEHMLSAFVTKVFSSIDRPAKNDELRVCFGIPARNYGNYVNWVNYTFQQSEGVRKLTQCLTYRANEDDAAAVGKHFRRCRDAMQTLGYSISLKFHAGEGELFWTMSATALAYLESAGRNFEDAQRLIREEVLSVKDYEERTKREIIQMMYDHSRTLSPGSK